MQRGISQIQFSILILILWGLLVAVVGWVRPLYYSNEEMHYASIAWEMWQHHHFILPMEGGQPYPEKGPLFFWLMHAGWALFGVSTWWVRLMPALFGLGTLFLLRRLTLQLWPQEPTVANLAPFVLLGTFFFAAKIPVARFDVTTTFFVVLSVYWLIKAVEQNKLYWLFFAIAVTLGLLTKGPVQFLFILPAALTMRWWGQGNDAWGKVYGLLIASLLLSILLVSCWLIPAVLQGGAQYAHDLLLNRSVGRIWQGGGYWRQDWAYYTFTFAMMLLPWWVWLPFWPALLNFIKKSREQGLDKRILLLLIIILSSILFLTFVKQKAPRYILPALPFAVILMTYIIVKYSGVQEFPVKGTPLYAMRDRKGENRDSSPSFRAIGFADAQDTNQEAIHRESLSGVIKKSSQRLIATNYLIAGLGYVLLVIDDPFKMHHKYLWVRDLSPLWGLILIAIGLFWWLWQEQKLTRVIMGLSVSTLLFWSCYNLSIVKAEAHYQDWRGLARQVAVLQGAGKAIAFTGPYQELEFFGKLSQPPVKISEGEINSWLQKNPGGWVVIRDYSVAPMQLRLISAQSQQGVV